MHSAQSIPSHITLVRSPATVPADEGFSLRRTAPQRSYQQRLHAVAPREAVVGASHLTRYAGLYSATLHQRSPELTTEDVIQVHLATVRESSSHRYWPSDVVEIFLTADVVKTSNRGQ